MESKKRCCEDEWWRIQNFPKSTTNVRNQFFTRDDDMKNKLFAALIITGLTSGMAHALPCTTGGHPGAPTPTAFSLTPDIIGDLTIDLVESRVVSSPELLAGAGTSPPPPSPPGTGGGLCGSVNAMVLPNTNLFAIGYLEHTPLALGIYRHQVHFDLTKYKGNSDPRIAEGARAWWPLVAWDLPADLLVGEVIETLRIDYSGRDSGLGVLLPNAMFNVYSGNALILAVVVKTNMPKVELVWSGNGQILLSLDVGEEAGSEIVQLPLTRNVGQVFQPMSFKVGRVSMPTSIRPALGEIEAASYLIEAPPGNSLCAECKY
jgi:hypothetical protein